MTRKTGKILIIDDDEDVLHAARLFLKQHVAVVHTEREPALIPPLLKHENYDVILLDMNFTKDVTSGIEGFHWLNRILDIDPSAVVVLITASPSLILLGLSVFLSTKPGRTVTLSSTFKLEPAGEALGAVFPRRSASWRLKAFSILFWLLVFILIWAVGWWCFTGEPLWLAPPILLGAVLASPVLLVVMIGILLIRKRSD